MAAPSSISFPGYKTTINTELLATHRRKSVFRTRVMLLWFHWCTDFHEVHGTLHSTRKCFSTSSTWTHTGMVYTLYSTPCISPHIKSSTAEIIPVICPHNSSYCVVVLIFTFFFSLKNQIQMAEKRKKKPRLDRNYLCYWKLLLADFATNKNSWRST
jgi:hypothetical protein